MKPLKLINNYVYVVLEHHKEGKDARIHGIYTTLQSAEGKYTKLHREPGNKLGYVSILKKPVLGESGVKLI